MLKAAFTTNVIAEIKSNVLKILTDIIFSPILIEK